MKNFNPHFLNHRISRSLMLCFFLLFSNFAAVSYATETSADDACVYGICSDPGEIGADQTIVRGTSPALLTETKAPTCEPGELEYLWMYYSASSGGWKPIATATSKTYQPHALFSTTYFLRCVRKKGCPTYVESNILRIEVVDCMPSGIDHEEACLGDPIKFSAQTVYSTNDVKYRWTFEGGSPSSSNSQYVDVTWNSEGLKKVTLRVIDGQCENTYEEEVYVINCDCKGFYCRVSTSADCGTGSARANGYYGKEPYAYRWSTGATTRRVSGLAPGTYSATVTDANGCECVRYFTIEGASDIGCSAYAKKNNSKCGGREGVAVAQGTGGSGRYYYSWSNGQVGAIAFGLSAGNYTVTIRDVVSGCSTSCSVKITEPSITCNIRKEDTQCGENNGSATAIGSGGSGRYRYNWSNWSTSQTITGLAPGTYTATVTDRRTNCRTTCSVTINGSQTISCSIDPSAATCNQANGEAVVTPSGGSGNYSYAWSTSPVQTTSTATGLAPGNYTATVTDNSTGCTTTCTTTINSVNDDLDLDLSLGCLVNNHGGGSYATVGVVGTGCQREVIATASGGSCSGTYSYSWSSMGSGSTSNVSCGTTVTVTVSCGGCMVSESIFVPEGISITSQMGTDPDCDNGGTTGTITVTATGGIPPLTYQLLSSPPVSNTTGVFNNVAPGPYRVVVSDASGCSSDFKLTDDISIDACDPCGGSGTVSGTGCDFGDSEPICGDCSNLPERNPGNTVIFCTDNNGSGFYDLEFSNCNSISGRCPIRVPIYNGTGPLDSEDSYNCDTYNTGSRLFDPVSDGQIKKAYDIVDKLNNKTQDGEANNSVELEAIQIPGVPTAKIFPNPFHQNVNIVLSDYTAFAKSLNIEVMSITGQIIQRQVVDAAAATYELNLGNQAKGIYIVRISGEGIKPEIHKVVKN